MLFTWDELFAMADAISILTTPALHSTDGNTTSHATPSVHGQQQEGHVELRLLDGEERPTSSVPKYSTNMLPQEAFTLSSSLSLLDLVMKQSSSDHTDLDDGDVVGK